MTHSSPDHPADRRVVVTGLGLLVPGGAGCAPAWDSAVRGDDPVDPEGFAGHARAAISDFDPKSVVDRKKALKLMGPNIQFALGASREAWTDSGREPKHADGAEAGIVLGVRTRPNDFSELKAVTRGSRAEDGAFSASRFGEEGSGSIFPLSMLRGLPNLVTSQVTIQLGLHGFSDSLTSGEISSLQAIQEGYHAVLRRDADVLLAGGADDLLDPISLGRLLAEHRRSGDGDPPPVSQGAAVMVLEDREAARARGASVHAELLGAAEGFGGTGDDDALSWTWQEVLRRAGRSLEDVGGIFLDATLARQGSRIEACLARVFPEETGRPLTVSQADRIGHTGAATGAVEAAFAVMALGRGALPDAGGSALPPGRVLLVSSASEQGGVVTLALGAEGGES